MIDILYLLLVIVYIVISIVLGSNYEHKENYPYLKGFLWPLIVVFYVVGRLLRFIYLIPIVAYQSFIGGLKDK